MAREILEKILHLAGNPGTRMSMAKECIRTHRNNFTSGIMGTEYLDVYSRQLGVSPHCLKPSAATRLQPVFPERLNLRVLPQEVRLVEKFQV